MNTERLYEFLVLSHVLNYTRLAKALYISQPILTRHIQALEAELKEMKDSRESYEKDSRYSASEESIAAYREAAQYMTVGM